MLIPLSGEQGEYDLPLIILWCQCVQKMFGSVLNLWLVRCTYLTVQLQCMVCLCTVQRFSIQRLKSGVFLSVYVVVNKSVQECIKVSMELQYNTLKYFGFTPADFQLNNSCTRVNSLHDHKYYQE